MDSLDGIVFALPDDDEDNLLDIRALLQPEWAPEYERLQESLYTEMIALEMRLLIFERLHRFPFGLFLVPEDYVFWKVVKVTLLEYVIVSTFTLFVDPRKDVLTIGNFRTQISSRLRDQESISKFNEHLKRSSFDKQIQSLSEQIKALRNNRFAHLSLNPKYEKKFDNIELSNLRALMNSAEHLFNLLCSPAYSSFAYLSYGTGFEKDTPLDKLLDLIVEHAPVTHAPEDDEGWPYIRPNFSEIEIQLLNYYRKRCRLPPVT